MRAAFSREETIMRYARYTAPLLVLLVAACSSQGTNSTSAASSAANLVVSASGALRVPDDYRNSYEALGTWAIAADKGQGSKELHVVYASPGAASARRRAGNFPDGTVLVKEVYDATTAPMTTGTVARAGKLKGWFVMVRDGHNSHRGNKLWGDGWGWSWFDADKPTATTSTDYRTDCLGCHEPARKTNLVFEEGYPILH